MEDNLMKSKWWDYRLVSPDTATMMFIHSFGKRMPSYNERHGKSAYVHILKTLDLNEPKKWSNWSTSQRLRRFCDAICMRYDEFWNWACEEHESLGHASMFMTAFGTECMRSRIQERMSSNRNNHIPVSKHPFFLAPAYKGCSLQIEYFGVLIEAIKRNYGASSIKVAIEMMDEGIIPRKYINRDRS